MAKYTLEQSLIIRKRSSTEALSYSEIKPLGVIKPNLGRTRCSEIDSHVAVTLWPSFCCLATQREPSFTLQFLFIVIAVTYSYMLAGFWFSVSLLRIIFSNQTGHKIMLCYDSMWKCETRFMLLVV